MSDITQQALTAGDAIRQTSIAQALTSSVGQLANVEFWLGPESMACKTGRIIAVNDEVITLRDENANTDILADSRLIAFVTLPATANSTADTSGENSTPQETTVAPTFVRNPRVGSQAAFNYAKRKARR